MTDSTNGNRGQALPERVAGPDARPGPELPRLGAAGLLRWAWRQLTSMRNALLLLLLLAAAAVPGSLFPQRPVNPTVVTQYLKQHPDTGPWLDRFQLFNVYSSVWFSAIYLLLFISLIGCVVPRAIHHARNIRSRPPVTPRRLSRMPEYGTIALPAGTVTAEQAVRDAARILRRRGYRVDIRGGDRPSVGAERGYLKEWGNLVFHTALIGVLASVAVGGMFGYRGQKILVVGDSFVNTLVSYDSFTPGVNFDDGQLDPFAVKLDDFQVKFDRESTSHYGQPIDFTATLTTRDSPTGTPKQHVMKVNDPVSLGGTSIFLVGNGYAPIVTVRGGDGQIAMQGPVVSVPNDSAYTSLLVIKAPDAKPAQLGFVGFLLPTAVVDDKGVAHASDPDPFNPRLNLNSYFGDLGLNGGVPKNVYQLDTGALTQLNGRDLPARGIVLAPGQSYTLPDGKGSISFDGLKRYIGVDIRHDPGQLGALVFSSLALLGLMVSLFTGRRRVWVRAGTHNDGRTMVECGLLARGEDRRITREGGVLRRLFSAAWQPGQPPMERIGK